MTIKATKTQDAPFTFPQLSKRMQIEDLFQKGSCHHRSYSTIVVQYNYSCIVLQMCRQKGTQQSLFIKTHFNLCLVTRYLFYNIVLTSAIQHESAVSIYMFLPPAPPRSQPSGLSQGTAVSPWVYTVTAQQRSILHMVMCKCQCYSLDSSHPLLPLLCPDSVLYVCVSVSALQIGSQCHFPRFYICVC